MPSLLRCDQNFYKFSSVSAYSFLYIFLIKKVFVIFSIEHYIGIRDFQTVAMICCAFYEKKEEILVSRRKTTPSESSNSVSLAKIR